MLDVPHAGGVLPNPTPIAVPPILEAFGTKIENPHSFSRHSYGSLDRLAQAKTSHRIGGLINVAHDHASDGRNLPNTLIDRHRLRVKDVPTQRNRISEPCRRCRAQEAYCRGLD